MKKASYPVLTLIFMNIIIIGFFLFHYCNDTAPWIGPDYRYFIPHMIDNYLFQKINGLAIHWYTPSFDGGTPVYPNPQDISYSLPQLLTWFVSPWLAVRLSIVIYVMIGFIAAYYCLSHLLEFDSLASILGAVFFSVNGFYIQHMAVGHVTFQTFPLLGIILIIFYSPILSDWMGGILLSFLAVLLLYAGSFEIIVLFIFAILLSLPVIYLIKPSLLNHKRLLLRALWGLGFSILSCGSKLYAVYSFMKFSPRLVNDQNTVNGLTGLIGVAYQLLGSMTVIPLSAWMERSTLSVAASQYASRLTQLTGSPYGMWELDISLSPALLLLLAGGLGTIIFRKPKMKVSFDMKRLMAIGCLILLIGFILEFTLAKGVIYQWLHTLPIFRSLRAGVRFPAAFIFPLSIVGAAIFNRWARHWKTDTFRWIVFLLLNGFALYTMGIYNQIPSINLQKRAFDIREVTPIFNEMRIPEETFPVKRVIPNADAWEVFQNNATNNAVNRSYLFEPFFEDYADQLRQALHRGSVFDIDNGYFNIINPTGYVYPDVNGTRPFERIQVSDKTNFQNFIARRQTDWKLPIAQHILNWITMIMLLGESLILLSTVVMRQRIASRSLNKVYS